MMEVYYQIEEWVCADEALGGKGYWTAIQKEEFPAPWRTEGQGTAEKMLYLMRVNQGRTVRLVRITEEVLS